MKCVRFRADGQVAGLCEPANDSFGFHKASGVVCIVEVSLAFHGCMSCMGLR